MEEKTYLSIDEVQLTVKIINRENDGIEVFIYDILNELKAYINLDVCVAGSNSKKLSMDIVTKFRARATQILVFPLTFKNSTPTLEVTNGTLWIRCASPLSITNFLPLMSQQSHPSSAILTLFFTYT